MILIIWCALSEHNRFDEIDSLNLEHCKNPLNDIRKQKNHELYFKKIDLGHTCKYEKVVTILNLLKRELAF